MQEQPIGLKMPDRGLEILDYLGNKEEVTQELFDAVYENGKRQYRKTEILKAILCLDVVRDKDEIDKLFRNLTGRSF